MSLVHMVFVCSSANFFLSCGWRGVSSGRLADYLFVVLEAFNRNVMITISPYVLTLSHQKKTGTLSFVVCPQYR